MGHDQGVAEPLMVSLFVVVRHELVDGAEQSPLPKQDQTIETLLPDGAHEALRGELGDRHYAAGVGPRSWRQVERPPPRRADGGGDRERSK